MRRSLASAAPRGQGREIGPLVRRLKSSSTGDELTQRSSRSSHFITTLDVRTSAPWPVPRHILTHRSRCDSIELYRIMEFDHRP